MEKITYKQIGALIGKSEVTIKGYKQNQPELLELLQLGARCKINGASEEQIALFCKLKQKIEENCKKTNL